MSTLQSLHKAHVERQMRFAAAARRAQEQLKRTAEQKAANTNVIFPRVVEKKPDPVTREAQDAHVIAYRRWHLYLELKDEFSGEECNVAIKKMGEEIINEVLLCFPGVTIAQIKGRHRGPTCLSDIRHIAVFEVCRQRPDFSMPMIGRLFGGRDHTTMIHSRDKVASLGGAEYVRKQKTRSLKRLGYKPDVIAQLVGMAE